MRRREVKWLEMLTQWDAYMLRNYRKVTMMIMMTIMHEQKLNGDDNVDITSILGTWALPQRNPTEYKGQSMASPLWSKISGNSHYTSPFAQQSSHRNIENSPSPSLLFALSWLDGERRKPSNFPPFVEQQQVWAEVARRHRERSSQVQFSSFLLSWS